MFRNNFVRRTVKYLIGKYHRESINRISLLPKTIRVNASCEHTPRLSNATRAVFFFFHKTITVINRIESLFTMTTDGRFLGGPPTHTDRRRCVRPTAFRFECGLSFVIFDARLLKTSRSCKSIISRGHYEWIATVSTNCTRFQKTKNSIPGVFYPPQSKFTTWFHIIERTRTIDYCSFKSTWTHRGAGGKYRKCEFDVVTTIRIMFGRTKTTRVPRSVIGLIYNHTRNRQYDENETTRTRHFLLSYANPVNLGGRLHEITFFVLITRGSKTRRANVEIYDLHTSRRHIIILIRLPYTHTYTRARSYRLYSAHVYNVRRGGCRTI